MIKQPPPLPLLAAEQADPTPLSVQDELCLNIDYHGNAQSVSINLSTKGLVNQILSATNDSILDATISTLAPHAAGQDQYEMKADAQFAAIEDQLGSLFNILKKKPNIPQPTVKFPCNFCSNTFETERGLRNHTRTHQET